jgi:hypothetical protein
VRWPALLVLVAVACSGAEGEAPQERDARRVVERYVDAVGQGDFAAANALACEELHVDPAQGRADLAALESGMGQVRGAETGVVRTPAIGLPGDVTQPVAVAYRVRAGAAEHDLRVLVTAVRDGERVVCASSAEREPGVLDVAGELRSESIVELPAGRGRFPDAPEGVRPTEEHAPPAGGDLGSRTRAWDRTTVTVRDFTTANGALEGARRDIERYVADAVARIRVPGAPEVVGLRVLAYDYLGVQPPDVGPYLDVVWAQYGTVLWTIAVGDVPTGSDHGEVARLATEVRLRNHGADA